MQREKGKVSRSPGSLKDLQPLCFIVRPLLAKYEIVQAAKEASRTPRPGFSQDRFQTEFGQRK